MTHPVANVIHACVMCYALAVQTGVDKKVLGFHLLGWLSIREPVISRLSQDSPPVAYYVL